MTNSKRASDLIGDRIKELRKLRDLTRDELAARCAELGAGLSAAMLVNIESGRPDEEGKRRRDVSVDELLILAVALDVPPALLLLPPDQAGEERTWLEITPKMKTSAWGLATWLSGESDQMIPKVDEAGVVSAERRRMWRQAAHPLRLYRIWMERFEAVAKGENEAALLALADVLEVMISMGITPPPTPDDWVAVMREKGWLKHPDEVPIQPKWSD
ncbi:helix-turn-helix domain-containing protein [Actinomadura rupiterrae]|uniref:helix-turn-helix domain-containing protein n=1 Tax=Actinomadura rupiterrae TaxID=559627 RepID=UPI0020A25987|nr:helix-turn-helix transcriptional regulator [Actinomadura rupiterrae]MCP2336142.1 transcriptional regulator with XRE-family HTH domain [Actinomadura rupiterrae]